MLPKKDENTTDELVDIFDEQGNKTGQVVPKSEAHDRSLWHAGAHVWIYNSKGEVLLQHRHPAKLLYPNAWDISAAGHIQSGDNPIDTIVREAQEELGLKIKPEDLHFIGITTANTKLPQGSIDRAIDWTYIARIYVDLKDLKMQETEVDNICWKPMDELEQDINNPEKFKEYAPREKYIYQQAITEIRERIKRDKK